MTRRRNASSMPISERKMKKLVLLDHTVRRWYHIYNPPTSTHLHCDITMWCQKLHCKTILYHPTCIETFNARVANVIHQQIKIIHKVSFKHLVPSKRAKIPTIQNRTRSYWPFYWLALPVQTQWMHSMALASSCSMNSCAKILMPGHTTSWRTTGSPA